MCLRICEFLNYITPDPDAKRKASREEGEGKQRKWGNKKYKKNEVHVCVAEERAGKWRGKKEMGCKKIKRKMKMEGSGERGRGLEGGELIG